MYLHHCMFQQDQLIPLFSGELSPFLSTGCEMSAQDFGSDFGRSRSRVRGAVPQRLAREESRIGSLFHCRLLYKMPRLIYFIYRSVLMSYIG